MLLFENPFINGVSSSAAASETGPISKWSAEGTANDIAGTNNGTLVGDTTYASGRTGQAFSFDGVGDYLNVGDLDLPSTFTIGAWIKPVTAGYQLIMAKGNNPFADRSYWFYIGVTGSLSLVVVNETGQITFYDSASVITGGQWNHVAAVYDGSAEAGQKIKFYVNGQNKAVTILDDAGGTPVNNSANSTVGGTYVYYGGLIDELEVFNRALSGAEINTIYENTPPSVESVSPANSATDVPVNSVITAAFAEDMDSSTIDTSSFTVNNGVAGNVSYDAPSKIATFTPSSSLSYNTTYTASISTAAKDSTGNNLPENYSWSFTTEIETGDISGRVTSDGALQAGAVIEAWLDAGTTTSATTGADGTYQISNLPTGSYTIRAKYYGNETKSKTGQIVVAGNTTTVNFPLRKDTQLFYNGNISGVNNNPPVPTTFTLSSTKKITYLMDYHWNSGTGQTPGTIALQHSGGQVYGPWQAEGAPGQGGVPNAYWITYPNIDLPTGSYTIIDSDTASWSQNDGSGFKGMSEVRGISPGPGNIISSNISSDSFWSVENSPYYVINSINIDAGKTLTIEPGVVVKFAQNANIFVDGHIEADGTSDNKIHFTDYRDDTVGGDTNGDGSASSPAPGWWRGVHLRDGATANFDYASIKYSIGHYIGAWTYTHFAPIYKTGTGLLNVTNTNISESNGHGIWLRESGVGHNIASNTIQNNGNYGILMQNASSPTLSINQNTVSYNSNSGIYSENSSPTISNNTVSNNTNYGLYVTGSSLPTSIVTNTFASNTVGPIGMAADSSGTIVDDNNTLTGALHIDAGTITRDTSWSNNRTYYVRSDIDINAEKTLTITPGRVIKFAPSTGILVSGHLQADATDDNKIHFTDYRDDTVGGDTNGDGTDSSPAPGWWRGVHLRDGATANFDYASIKYSIGHYIGPYVYTHFAPIYKTGTGLLNVTNTNISESSGHGLWMLNTGQGHNIASNTIQNNGNYGILMQNASSPTLSINQNTVSYNSNTGIYSENSSPTISNNTVSNNTNYGLYVTGETTNPDIFQNKIYSNSISGIYTANSANPVIGGSLENGNDIYNNALYGIQNATTTLTVSAQYNWWGNESGPYHGQANPNGNANSVSDNVDFGNYLGASAIDTAPNIGAEPIFYDFGEVNEGSASIKTLTITNNGTGNLSINSILKSGNDVLDFTLQNDSVSGQSIAPSESGTLEVTFLPLSAGIKNVSLYVESNDPDQPELEIILVGTGVDITPPTTSIVVNSTSEANENGWYRAVPTISLSSSEPGTISYSLISTNSYSQSTGTVSFSIPEGQSTLYYSSTDLADNSEEVKTQAFNVDITEPTIDTIPNKTTHTIFTQAADAIDSNGIVSYLWSQQSGPGTVSFSQPTSPTTSISASMDGTYTIRLTATDIAGNSAEDDFTLIWDTTNPNIAYSSVAKANNLHVKGILSVPASAADTLSSLSKVQLYIGNAIKGEKTSAPFKFSIDTTTLTNGKKAFKLVAYDKAGNSSQVTRYYYVDNTKPTIPSAYMSPSIPAKGTYAKAYYKINDGIAPYVYVTVQIRTTGGKILFTAGPEKKTKGKLLNKSIKMPNTAGVYIYRVIAKDYAGNQLVKNIKFTVK